MSASLSNRNSSVTSYANMDFIVLSALLHTFMLMLTLSYDICCQWSQNLTKRMLQFRPFMWLIMDRLHTAKFVVPKFHIYNHGTKCVLSYSPNFLCWSAASDLEDPERWWAHINPASISTKEMSEGSHHDTIDDHAWSWNWRKIVGFGMSLILRDYIFCLMFSFTGLLFSAWLKKALVMQVRHRQAFMEFNSTFPPVVIDKWERIVSEWDKDKKKKNLYEEPVASK
jgi:hypothetical protein